MRILITGDRPSAGSWRIRAEQLSAAVGAHVSPRTADVLGYDVCVAVKRHAPQLSAACARVGVPLVWDIVDPWPQPSGNEWDEVTARAWLQQELHRVRPALVLTPTRAMAADVEALGFQAVCVPHHHRACSPSIVRDHVAVVGYDGSLQQLGERWIAVVEAECRERGWRFLAGHADAERYALFDIVLGLRGASGYAPRRWKSGVKLANAHAAGVPFVGSPEAGYTELRIPGVERLVDSEAALHAAFDALTPATERRRVSGWMRAIADLLSIDAVAKLYRDALVKVAR